MVIWVKFTSIVFAAAVMVLALVNVVTAHSRTADAASGIGTSTTQQDAG